MIIEMIGAPGAGKSTLRPAVEDWCRAAGLTPFTPETAARPLAGRTVVGRLATSLVPAALRSSALWAVFRVVTAGYTVRSACTRPHLTAHLIRTQWRRPRAADARQRRVAYWYLRTMGTAELAAAQLRRDEVVIFDEGLAHRAVQLHASTAEVPDATTIDRYVTLLPEPDLVVHVAASASTCVERVRTRGRWERLAHRSDDEVDRFVQNAHTTTALVRDAIGARGWTVADIDNDDDDRDDNGAGTHRAVEATPPVRAVLSGGRRA